MSPITSSRISRSLAIPCAVVGLLACAGDTFAPVPSGAAGKAGNGGASAIGGNASGASAGASLGGAAGASGSGGANAGSGGISATGGTSGASGASGGGSTASGSGGAGGGVAGAGGKGGTGGNAGTTGKGGTGGNAGSAGIGGVAGNGGGGGVAASGGLSGGAGAGGAASPICAEISAGPPVTGFSPCNENFSDCLLTTVPGTVPRLVPTTCGLGVAFATEASALEFMFPTTPGLPALTYPATSAAHTIAMLGPRLLIATGGDSMFAFTFGDGANAGFAPVQGGGPVDTLGYRSLVATNDLVAWTGRQGAPVAWQSPPDLGCTTDPGGGGCTGEVIDPPPTAGDPVPGWGVTAAGKVLYWSHPLGVSRIDTSSPTTVTTFPIGSPTVPSSLATIDGRPLLAQGNLLTLLPASFDDSSVKGVPSPLPIDGEVRDLLVKDGVLYVLLARNPMVPGGGSTTLATVSFGQGAPLQVPRVLVTVPAAIDPLSLAVDNDGLFFSGRAGQIYRVKRTPP